MVLLVFTMLVTQILYDSGTFFYLRIENLDGW